MGGFLYGNDADEPTSRIVGEAVGIDAQVKFAGVLRNDGASASGLKRLTIGSNPADERPGHQTRRDKRRRELGIAGRLNPGPVGRFVVQAQVRHIAHVNVSGRANRDRFPG